MADREDEEGRALHQAVPAPLPPQREVLQVTLPTAQPRVHPQGPSLAPHDSATGLTMHLTWIHLAHCPPTEEAQEESGEDGEGEETLPPLRCTVLGCEWVLPTPNPNRIPSPWSFVLTALLLLQKHGTLEEPDLEANGTAEEPPAPRSPPRPYASDARLSVWL